MKKTVTDIFDEAKAGELEKLLSQNSAPEVSADILSSVKSKVYAKSGLAITKKKNHFNFHRKYFAAVAACLVLIIGVHVAIPMMSGNGSGLILNPDNRPDIPLVTVQDPSSAPQYYGDSSSGGASDTEACLTDAGRISVTAKLSEALPDVYTFYHDRHQREFRLLRMQTVKLLEGSEMTDEFYYLVPVSFMTDFSAYDSFVIRGMAQYTYEYSVLYNKTQDSPEKLNLVIFGYSNLTESLGYKFVAFDSEGNFDERLWSSNDAWIDRTSSVSKSEFTWHTITELEDEIQNYEGYRNLRVQYVHLLKDISGEAAEVLTQLRDSENGVFVPHHSSSITFYSPEVQFFADRYIGGFLTNERISVWNKEWNGGDTDIYACTKAHFDDDDMERLPDLASAFESVKTALNSGIITPPHFNNQEKLRHTANDVFAWYAKTEEGVIGIVKVTWRFVPETNSFNPAYNDDAYYFIEYGADECKAVDRDALIEMFGEYETTHIYTGRYNEYGYINHIMELGM